MSPKTSNDNSAELAKIEAYLSALPPEARTTLEHMRQTIKRLAPDAVEALSYGMPAFKYRGKGLAGYAAFKNHCSYFPMGSSILAELKDELAAYEYTASKGGFHFPIGEPPADALIEKLLMGRQREIDAKLED